MQDHLSTAMSEQLNLEFYSSYLYLSMSSHCNRQGFAGFGNWLYVQAQEELAHANHLYQYMLERGATPVLAAIAAPPRDFESMGQLFEEVLTHESTVTQSINNLATMSLQDNDHAAYQFLQWYVNEQVEEMSNAELICQKLRHIGTNTALLFMMDGEMAGRIYQDPFAPGAGA